MSICLPEDLKIVRVQTVTACNAFTTSDYICCKYAHKVWFIIGHAGATDTDLTLGLREATNVAGGTSAVVATTFPIWTDVDHGIASDALIRAADAATDVIDPATEGAQLTVFEWDPSKHTAGYDCIAVRATGGDAADTVWVLALISERYPQDPPPSAIVD